MAAAATTTSSSAILLGTPYILSQSTTNNSTQTSLTPITPSLCSNFSAFKNVLRSSRALDDSIALRLNRANALARHHGDAQESCDSFWKDLITRWDERRNLLEFCHQSSSSTPPISSSSSSREPIENGLDLQRHRKNTLIQQPQGRGETELQVKRRQIANETNVEAIIRARSLALFVSKCPYHPQLPQPIPLPSSLTQDEPESFASDPHPRRGRDGKGGVNWNG